MMKKTIFILLFFLMVLFSLSEGITYLKLRAHDHPKFLRVVLEGDESTVASGTVRTVNQRGKDIMVRFPHADLVLGSEKMSIPYRIDKNVIIFSPGVFSGFKVFTLKFTRRKEKRKKRVLLRQFAGDSDSRQNLLLNLKYQREFPGRGRSRPLLLTPDMVGMKPAP
jgi:hypothetical protein